ncbi:MAG: 30S ribosomal protein S2 [Candidatus Magasanikbacteria bacterium]|nr:30S ribosomal protein S2 [Candidatus Magasanikbacteria bacterium]
MSKIPDVLELLKAGAHFGHKISKWHPKMAPFIFTERNQVHIINLEETQKKLQEALNFLRQSAAQNKIILFVGTKDQAQEIITRHAKDAGVPFVTNRWLGGLLTNFNEIHSLIKKFRRLKTERDTGELGKYTKKEQIRIGKENRWIAVLM